jgi:hypothetical protein
MMFLLCFGLTGGIAMAAGRVEEFAPVLGEEFRPALGKLWTMLLVFLLMVPGGALAALSWWYQIELPGGKVLSAKAAIVGLLAMPLGIFLSLVMVALLALAKRLVIGENCVQLLARGRVVVHIPYQNVAETYAQGEARAGVVGLRLRNRADSATLVPSWTKDRYEIQVLTYGKPLDYIHQALIGRLAAFRAGGTVDRSFGMGTGISGTAEQAAAADRPRE